MTDPVSSHPPSSGWRSAAHDTPSLIESFRSIPVHHKSSWIKKFLAFFGPGYLVAVGYMDPGNWATSLAGGAQFGFALLFVVLLSNIMAIILQSLCARLAIGSGRDLAQACRDGFSKKFSIPLWILAEIAICATDLAEIIGTAIALNLLFKIPLEIGVIITALDVFLILWLQSKGFRYIEAFIISLLGIIATCFVVQIGLADPHWHDVITGFAPTTDIITNPNMLYLALGIIGATVMPHNLYLHSAIVQTRDFGSSLPEKREALKFATLDSTIALFFALTINASILILSGSVFYTNAHHDIVDLDKAHALLTPLLGSNLAPTLFGIALLCCGLSSTVTATMAGQVVMEGFMTWRISAWLRRLITRGLAIIPAGIVIIYYGADEAGKLLILSQVILSLQLPFAIVPLILFTSNAKKMNGMVAPKWLMIIASIIAITIITLNIKMLSDVFLG